MESKFKEIFFAYLPLAFITFGGPSAHISLFYDKFVSKNKWITDQAFAELFAISQSLPGPASTQLAYSIALVRGGLLPAIMSFFVWSLPMMIFMTMTAIFVRSIDLNLAPWIKNVENGFASAAIGLIALAAYNLSDKILIDKMSKILAFISGSCAIYFTGRSWIFPLLMMFGGTVSVIRDSIYPSFQQPRLLEDSNDSDDNSETVQEEEIHTKITPFISVMIISSWIILLIVASTIRYINLDIKPLQIASTFFLTGSIIFGGGPVVVPLLYTYVVENGWVNENEFLIGLAIINALPGPMFNFAAFCGALAYRTHPVIGAILAYIGIFFPGLFLKTALIPLWRKYRTIKRAKSVLRGINASAVGLVYSAVYFLWVNAIYGSLPLTDSPIFTIVMCATFIGVGFLRIPAPLAIVFGGIIGYLMNWS